MEKIENFMLYALISWFPYAILTGWLFNDVSIGAMIGLCQFLIAAVMMIGYNEDSDGDSNV